MFMKGKRKMHMNCRIICSVSVVGRILEATITDKPVNLLKDDSLIGTCNAVLGERNLTSTDLVELFSDFSAGHDCGCR